MNVAIKTAICFVAMLYVFDQGSDSDESWDTFCSLWRILS